MNKVITVVSGKGGTGKSTVAVGLGRTLTEMGFKVLLVDCDCGMRGLDLMLGVSRNLVFDISDAASGDCEIEDAVYPCNKNGSLYLVPAPQNADEELSPAVFKKFIAAVEHAFDYIIVDSPAGVGKGFETSVSTAELVIVVCNTEPTSVRGCSRVRDNLEKFDIRNTRLIINRFDKKKFAEMCFYSDLDAVIDQTGIRLLGIVPEDEKMVAAIQIGSKAGSGSPAVKAFERIAERIRGTKIPLKI